MKRTNKAQNIGMRKIFYIVFFVVSMCIFSAIAPYPVFSNHTNITEGLAYQINNYRETEISPKSNQTPEILMLDFQVVNNLLPVGAQFEIFDIFSDNKFVAQRTGGVFHLDVEPKDKANAQQVLDIAQEWNWQRRPALVKLNDFTYVPASISLYPHGYSALHTQNGHFCLHFQNSKTDGTKQTDAKHQRCVRKAESLGKNFIKNIDN